MIQSKTILISTLTASLLLLTGCTTQTATNTNAVSNTNATVNTNTTINTNKVTNTNVANDNANVEVVTNTNEAVGNENTNNSNVNSDVDTSDWLTYTNEEYGFSFKYPSNYVVSSRNDSNGNDLIEDSGVVFIIGRKITDSQIDPVSITFYDHTVNHPTKDDINSLQFGPGPMDGSLQDNVISETSYSVRQYSGEKFRVKGLTGSYQVDEDHKLKDVAEYYYLDSSSKTVEIRLTDEAATGVDTNALLNSLQF